MSDFLKQYISDSGDDNGSRRGPVRRPRPPAPRQKSSPQNDQDKYKADNTTLTIPVMKRGKKVKDMEVPKFPLRPRAFTRKSTVLYGTSGSGKTYMIKDIMYLLRNKFARVWVFCPTNAQNHMYDHIVPNPMIFDTVDLQTIKDIYEFQKQARSIYEIANNLVTLRRLFMKVASYKAKMFEKKLIEMEKIAFARIRATCKDPVDIEKREEQVDEIMKDRLRRHYKAVINQQHNKLKCMELKEQERYSLQYYNFNPDSLVIFDDAMMEVDKIVKRGKKEEDPVVQNFFFKGRHIFLTTMYAMQSDKMLDADLRKNAHNTIFTSSDEANSFFSRSSNGISNDEKADAMSVIRELFDDKHAKTFKKLIYLKDEKNKYQYITAVPRSRFPMCAPIIRAYCKRIEEKGSHIDKNNKFFKRFAEYSRNN